MIRRISDKNLPKTLYKYRDWNNKFHQKLITRQEIYFPKPSEFNDPFDGNIPVRWDIMTFEDCYEKNLEILKIGLAKEDPKQVEAYARKVTREKKLWHPDKLKRENEEQLKKWDSEIGLLSLSSIPTNILMWSHYSLNHQGFVVGLDSNSLASDYNFDYIEPINYQEEYPLISGKDDTTIQFYKKFFLKSEFWEYEKEWRISYNHIPNRVVRLKPKTISKIIIGCKADLKTESQIIKNCKKHLGNGIPIFKTIKQEDKFGLELSKIN